MHKTSWREAGRCLHPHIRFTAVCSGGKPLYGTVLNFPAHSQSSSRFRKLGQMSGCSSLLIMLPAAPKRLKGKKDWGTLIGCLAITERSSSAELKRVSSVQIGLSQQLRRLSGLSIFCSVFIYQTSVEYSTDTGSSLTGILKQLCCTDVHAETICGR